VRPASEAERARLNETFAELCRISSPFGSERAIADDVTARLRAMGLEVDEDDAAGPAGAGAGNLLARIAGRADRSERRDQLCERALLLAEGAAASARF